LGVSQDVGTLEEVVMRSIKFGELEHRQQTQERLVRTAVAPGAVRMRPAALGTLPPQIKNDGDVVVASASVVPVAERAKTA
jgi:hypothetical protein